METTLILIAIVVIGGFIAVWVTETIIDLAITSRVFDDPFKGKMLATIVAFFIVAVLSWMATNDASGFYLYLPGAALVGLLEARSARKIQAKIDAADESTTFE